MLHPDLPGAREEDRARSPAGPRRRKPKGGTSPTRRSTRCSRSPPGRSGWADISRLATGHSFQVLLDRYVRRAGSARPRGRGREVLGGAVLGGLATASTSPTDILVDPKIGLGRGAFYVRPLPSACAGRCREPAVRRGRVRCRVRLRRAPSRARSAAGWSPRWPASPGRAASSPASTRASPAFPSDPYNPTRAGRRRSGSTSTSTRSGPSRGRSRRAGLRRPPHRARRGLASRSLGGLLSRIPKVGLTAGTLVHLSAATYASVSVYARKPA